MTDMATPSTRIPAPGIMKFTIQVSPSLVITAMRLVSVNHVWE